MDIIKNIIEVIFGLALFINALLFIPQSLTILKTKSIDGLSPITFIGFLIIQISVMAHGYLYKDYLLVAGYALSVLTCGFVVLLILKYKKNNLQNVNLKEIFEQLPGYIYWKDKNGVFLGCNNAFSELIGLNIETVQEKTEYNLFTVKEAAQLWQTDYEVIQTGQPKILEEERTINGDSKTFFTHKNPLRNSNGDIIGILCTAVDITEYKRANIENLEMLENIIALMPGHVYWMNKDGYYLGCNDNQAKSAGLISRKEIIGKSNKELPWNFNTNEISETLDSINKQVMSSGKEITVEEPAISPVRGQTVFLSTKVPLYNKTNKVVGMLGISIDITERKRHEKELLLAKEVSENASKLKDDFILNMEHDIRTPLAAINMIATQMSKKEDDLSKHKKLVDIAICSKELMDYCYGTIEYLKARFASNPVIEKKFDLEKLISRIINIERPAYDSKNLAFSLEISNDIPKILIGDEFRLERILINLLNNAIKFTNRGFVKFNVKSVKSVENRKIIIQFIIEDSGIGIHESKLNIIYEKFARVFNSSQGLYKGQGLGLTIVKKFTDDMEGEVEIESILGKGTKVICTYLFKVPISAQE